VIVVSDTSPLSYLHQIGQLKLLQALYGQAVIPAVEKELRAAAELHGGFDWSGP
jgi:predicted nucleic acid-binding protein